MNAAAAIRAKLLAKYPTATLVGRGLTGFTHRLPDLAPGKPHFAVDVGLGPMHYEDNTGALQEIDDALADDGADGFSVRTLQTPHLLRIASTGKRRFYPNRYDNRFVEFSALPNMGTPTRGENYLTWDKLHFGARLESSSAGIKFAFILKDSLAPTSISFNVALSGLTRQGRFLLADGVPVARMRLPTAVDAAGTERDCTFTLTASKVTIALDTTGLVFPIEIDPTVDAVISASADDCRYTHSSGSFQNDGLFSTVGAYSATVYKYCTGMRFTLTAPYPPAGISITHAHFQVMPQAANDGAACYSKIRGELADSGTFSDAANFHQRRFELPNNITTTAVAWGPIAAWTVDGLYKESPEIMGVIQEIVNYASSHYAGGLTSYVVLWWDDGDDPDGDSTHSSGNRRLAYSMENGATKYPLLHFEYTPHASFGQVF